MSRVREEGNFLLRFYSVVAGLGAILECGKWSKDGSSLAKGLCLVEAG